MLSKLSNWYDHLQEPYRFVAFFYFVFGAFFPFMLGMITYEANIIIWPSIFGLLGLLHLAFFYTFAIYRAMSRKY